MPAPATLDTKGTARGAGRSHSNPAPRSLPSRRLFRSPVLERPGFSLLEVLVASTLFATLALGILPLFTRAALLNQAGRGATVASHLLRSRAEELLRLPIDRPDLESPDGASVQKHYLARGAHRWSSREPTAPAAWVRTTTLRAYPIEALADGRLSPSEALPAGIRSPGAPIWEIEVTIEAGAAASLSAAGRRATLHLLKAR